MEECPVELVDTCAYNLNMPYQVALLNVKAAGYELSSLVTEDLEREEGKEVLPKDAELSFVQAYAEGNRVIYSKQDPVYQTPDRDRVWSINFNHMAYVTAVDQSEEGKQRISIVMVNLDEETWHENGSQSMKAGIENVPDWF
jgi:hypothetical protein